MRGSAHEEHAFMKIPTHTPMQTEVTQATKPTGAPSEFGTCLATRRLRAILCVLCGAGLLACTTGPRERLSHSTQGLSGDDGSVGDSGTDSGPPPDASAQDAAHGEAGPCSGDEALTYCSDATTAYPGCVDLQTDPNNCGSCGNTCASGECSAGMCVPCGSLGESCCPPSAGSPRNPWCVGAYPMTCDPDTNTCKCAEGTTSCDRQTCQSLDYDNNNCGTCGHQCPGHINGSTACCNDGECVPQVECDVAGTVSCVDQFGVRLGNLQLPPGLAIFACVPPGQCTFRGISRAGLNATACKQAGFGTTMYMYPVGGASTFTENGPCPY
jgi:hypothetical protein